MLAYLEGVIIATTVTGAIIKSGNLGYEVTSSHLTRLAVGSPISLYTVLHVGSDNQPLLLGFESAEGRTLYYLLVKVPGVGPKTALRIIESAPLDSLKTAIVEGDYQFFTRVKGLGKKNAQKIILELKNTLVDLSVPTASQELYSALTSLGFTTSEIDRVVRGLDLSDLSEQAALKLVLQALGS